MTKHLICHKFNRIMRKSLVVGILKEEKNKWERRAPLTPSDIRWLVQKGIEVEVESSPIRVFKDKAYEKNGAKIVKEPKKASFLVGIKEPRKEKIREKAVYMFFSHTTKGQSYNMLLLRELLEKEATLVECEKITDRNGKRLVYFGRFAGICGVTDSLYYCGRKLKERGINNPFSSLNPSWTYKSLEELKGNMEQTAKNIEKRGFDKRISPFIIGITGHGNVSNGAHEVLNLLNPIEIHPKDMKSFIRHQKYANDRIYKIVFLREEKFRKKDRRGYYFEEYLAHPERFESNLDKYLSFLNILLNGSYWDDKYPRLVTKKMIRKLCGRQKCRLEFIGDISCDIKGSVEINRGATTPDDPTYTYNPKEDNYTEGYKGKGVTVLAVDNLPAELPKDSSREFSGLIRDYVYQIAAHGVRDLTKHAAIPLEIRKAVITQNGHLCKKYQYLHKYLKEN